MGRKKCGRRGAVGQGGEWGGVRRTASLSIIPDPVRGGGRGGGEGGGYSDLQSRETARNEERAKGEEPNSPSELPGPAASSPATTPFHNPRCPPTHLWMERRPGRY